MTREEEKELLLKDLSARLLYGFFVHRYSDNADIRIDSISTFGYFLEYSEGEDFKPYLRPLSSMTEEEKKIYQSKQTIIFDFKNNKLYLDNYYSLDYLNSIHVDYRGLIEKGLALEALEGMYNIKKK